MSDKVRENRLRRVAKRRGWRLVKSPRRDRGALDYGTWALVDERNNIVFGGNGPGPYGYSASVDEIEAYLTCGA